MHQEAMPSRPMASWRISSPNSCRRLAIYLVPLRGHPVTSNIRGHSRTINALRFFHPLDDPIAVPIIQKVSEMQNLQTSRHKALGPIAYVGGELPTETQTFIYREV